MQIIPGTHKEPDYVHVETYADNNLLARGQTIQEIDDSKAVKLELKAGQFSLHHERLVHGSAPNRSNDRRLGMSFTYLPTHVRCNLPNRTAGAVPRASTSTTTGSAIRYRECDRDPVCWEAIRFWIEGYADPNVTQEALVTR